MGRWIVKAILKRLSLWPYQSLSASHPFSWYILVVGSWKPLKTIENQGELTESGHFLRAMLRGEEMPTNLPTPCPALTTLLQGNVQIPRMTALRRCVATSWVPNVSCLRCPSLQRMVFTCFHTCVCTFFRAFSHQMLILWILSNPVWHVWIWYFKYLILLMSSGLPYFGRAVSSSCLIMLVQRKRRRGDRQVKNADMSDTRTTYMTASDRTAGFQKNEYWASCKTSCTPGIDPADPPEHATPWTCKARCSFRSSQALGPWDFVIFVGFPLVSVGFQPGRCCPRRSWSKHSRSQTIFRARWLSCATNSLP